MEVDTFMKQEIEELACTQTPMTIHVHLNLLRKAAKVFKPSNKERPLSLATPASAPTTLNHPRSNDPKQQQTTTAANEGHRNTWENYQLLQDIDMDATLSIYLQCHKTHVKRTAHIHKEPENIAKYIQRLYSQESILDIATSIRFPPYMLMRYLVKHGNLLGNKRKKIMGTAGHTIEDNILRQAVQQAAATDLYCSPAADIVRLNVGIEYELILQQKL